MQILKTVVIAVGLAGMTPAFAENQGSLIGVMPGMTLETVDKIVTEQGFVQIGKNRGQGEHPSYIINYARMADEIIFSVEMPAQGDQSQVFRTNLLLPLSEDNPSAALIKEMTVKYQTGMTCQDDLFEFHYDADWQSTDEGSCGLRPIIPFSTMSDESLSFFSQPQEWRYTTVVAKSPDEPTLLIAVQDNLGAARMRLPQLSWDTETTAVAEQAVDAAKPQSQEPEAPSAALPDTSEPADLQKAEFLPGTFHIREIHGVSLLMMRETAIQALLDSGFKTQKPPSYIQPRDIVKNEARIEYAVFRDNNAHDRYAYSEEHWFKRGRITIHLRMFPTPEGWKVGAIGRTEEMEEPIFEQAALQQLTDRAGGLQPRCAVRETYALLLGWAMNSDWSILKTAKDGGYCLHSPEGLVNRPYDKMEEYTQGLRGSIQFTARMDPAGGEKIKGLSFSLSASRFIVSSADYALRMSEESRAEKAATQKISDF